MDPGVVEATGADMQLLENITTRQGYEETTKTVIDRLDFLFSIRSKFQ